MNKLWKWIGLGLGIAGTIITSIATEQSQAAKIEKAVNAKFLALTSGDKGREDA